MINTENKNWWVKEGYKYELKFIDFCKNKLKMNIKMNPDKETNPYVPDLIVNEKLADLKTQTTPFFTSKRYNFNPNYTVTFNKKDFNKYNKLYSNIDIYFWVNWKDTNWNGLSVNSLHGIFFSSFNNLKKIINENKVEHFYKKRVNDVIGNAKSSYLIDVRKLERIYYDNSI